MNGRENNVKKVVEDGVVEAKNKQKEKVRKERRYFLVESKMLPVGTALPSSYFVT